MPFGVVVDALDDHVEACSPGLAARLGPDTCALLDTRRCRRCGPRRRAGGPAPGPGRDLTGRYRIYRGMRRLLEDLAVPHGLVLILDDVHWADDASIELLDHLVRHPPRGRVLVAIAYRPAQASARLAALLASATTRGRQVMVGPLTLAETQELLGPGLSRPRCRALHEASGGNPFYLEALARMDQHAPLSADGLDGSELPPAVRAALQLELAGLSPAALRVAQAAAVAADEFEPGPGRRGGRVSEGGALAALNETLPVSCTGAVDIGSQGARDKGRQQHDDGRNAQPARQDLGADRQHENEADADQDLVSCHASLRSFPGHLLFSGRSLCRGRC